MSKEFDYIFGAGGGGEEPTRTDDNLFSEDIVEFALAVSEGPIRGLTEGAKSFFVGDTTLVSQTGSLNFQKFAVGVHPGYPEDSAKPLELKLGGTTSNTSVNVELQKDISVTRQTSAVLRNTIDQLEVRIYFARLLYADTKGNTGYQDATFKIEYKKVSDASWTTAVSNPIVIRGKTSSGYAKDFSISVPRVNEDWMIRVTKLSDDNSETTIVNLVWESFQCVTKEARKYPYTAILHGLGVADGQFSSLPQFSGVFDGMIVRVPSNYNPDLRTYDETTPWNGAFKFAWTNNNAWILYHLLVDPRAGLAAHYPYIDVNRFDFYDAGKWCDESVTAGTGTQPRFTFNAVLNEPRNALEMLAYVAGSFNALLYDDLSGKIHLKVDKDDAATQIFTPENVSAEGFTYSYTDASSRVNDISVAFVNPDLDWNEDRRRIVGVTTDEAAIAKHGRIPFDFIAVGCTNEYEAIRRAQYRLISAQTEKTIVKFITTRVGTLVSLYEIILVADPTMGWSQTGRLQSYDSQYIYLRDPIFIEENIPYILKVQTTNGIQEVNILVEAIGYVNRFVLAEPMPSGVPEYAVFSLEQAGGFGYAKPFRVTNVEPVEGSPHSYSITGIEVNRAKYPIGDNVATIPEFQYSYKQPVLPSEPTNLLPLSGNNYTISMPTGEVVDRIFFTWKAPSLNSTLQGYEVRWKNVEDSQWEFLTSTAEACFLSPVVQGQTYDVQVRATFFNTKSRWVSTTHEVVARSVAPDAPTGLTALGGLLKNKLDWEFGASYDYKLVEVWGGASSNTSLFTKLTDVAYPQSDWEHLGLGAGQTFYYRVRALSKTNQYSLWSSIVSAVTSSTPGPLLTLLNEQITSSQLVPALSAMINDIPNLTTAIVEQDTAIDGLNAKHTVKIQANGFVTGYGLAVTANDATPTSSFVVLANNFAFAIPGQAAKYPFVIGNVGGISTVGVNGALVVDGTITATAINTNGLVIRSSSGVPLFGAGVNLDVSYVNGLGAFATLGQITIGNSSTYIASGAIGNALIGDFIQSANFNGNPATNSPGTLGWYLGKSGTNSGKLYLNDIYARGNIEASTLKVGVAMVKTLNVETNAITARIPTYSASGIVVNTTGYFELQVATIVSTGGQLTVTVGFSSEVGGAAAVFRVTRNGTTIFDDVQFGSGAMVSFPFVDSPSAGTYTYRLYAKAITYYQTTLTHRHIILEEFKR